MKGLCGSLLQPYSYKNLGMLSPTVNPLTPGAIEYNDKYADLSSNPESAEFTIDELIAAPIGQGLAKDYFKSVAEWLKNNPAAYIKITIYTLDEAMQYEHLLRGLDLANSIKAHLIELGAAPVSIHISSMLALNAGSHLQTVVISLSVLPEYN